MHLVILSSSVPRSGTALLACLVFHDLDPFEKQRPVPLQDVGGFLMITPELWVWVWREKTTEVDAPLITSHQGVRATRMADGCRCC